MPIVRKLAVTLALFVILSVFAPTTAMAGDVTLDMSVAQTEVEIGGTIALNLTLSNQGAEAVKARELLLDDQSVRLHVRFGDDIHYVSRIHSSPFTKESYEPKSVEPGASISGAIELPAVAVGDYSLYAEYNGMDRIVLSKVVTFKVTPSGTRDKVAVKMETSLGTMIIELKPESSLATVMNFAGLVQQGFYDGLQFYAVMKDQQRAPIMAYAGDPNNIGGPSGPGYTIPYEKNLEFHKRGSLSMLRAPQHLDTAGSQFMLMITDKREYAPDGFYVVFGQVTEGLDTLDRLGAAEIRDPKEGGPPNKPKDDISITKATLELR